jgi:hypothetical protein
MTRVANSFESPESVEGTSLGTGNTGGLCGTAFEQILSTANTVFSLLHPAHGKYGMRCRVGGGVTNSQAIWKTATFGVQSHYWGRCYLDGLTGYAGVDPQLGFFTTLQGGVVKYRVALDAAGHVVVKRPNIVVTTSSTIIQLGTRYRIEVEVFCSTTAEVSTVWIYDAAGNLLETNISAPWAGEANHDEYRWGLSAASVSVDAYFDDLCLDTAGKIGAEPEPILGGRWTGALTEEGVTVSTLTTGIDAVRLKVSTAADLSVSPVYTSFIEPDGDGYALHTINGLEPATQYSYGVELNGVVQTAKLGKFKTTPRPGQVASFSFLVASCANSQSTSTVFDAMRARTGPYGGPLFFQHLGDLHYAEIATDDRPAYRGAYYRVLSSARQGELLAQVPSFYIWSDHDTGANNHIGGTPGLVAAQAVYRQVVPCHELAADDAVYYSFQVGRVLFICTDGRSLRDSPAGAESPSKTMLGATQKAWLKDRLLDPAPVKVWCNEVTWIGTASLSSEGWQSFSTERQELADHIISHGVQVFYCGGDVHVLAADDGANSVGGIAATVSAPMDQSTFINTGTYNRGSYPNPAGAAGNQYGWVDITDTGSEITVAWVGYDEGGTARVTLSKTYPAPLRINANPAGPLLVGSVAGPTVRSEVGAIVGS